MRLRTLIAAVLVAGALLVPAGAASAAASSNSPYGGLVSQFMCVSCHEPLELVSSPQALSEKAYLNSLVAKGLTDAQIKDAMVSQYGPEVLARPPAQGFDLAVYILPPLALLTGLALLAYTLPKWRARSRRAAVTPIGPGAPPLDPADASRLDDELDRFL